MVDERVEFVNKEVDGPEGGVVGFLAQARRPAAANLVVEDDGFVMFGVEVDEWKEVLVCGARTAVESE